jgi:hypothetical protein
MNQVIGMLVAFVALGLASRRLGRGTYVAMGLVIMAYVAYAYNK